MGSVTQWGLITGRKNSGKTTVAGELAKQINGHCVEMSVISEEVKKRL
jgi:uridine kinase